MEPRDRADAIERRAKVIPNIYRGGYRRAAAGTCSPRAAIKAHCLECVGWVRREIELCTSLACPLWAFRPFVGSQESAEASDFTSQDERTGLEG
jgi:hypothetical protein